MLALVLGGGNALGAYHGGIVAAMEAEGVTPDWVAGSSMGAVMGALIAGNPPGKRLAAVREFWRRGTSLDGPASWLPDAWRKPFHTTAALQARIVGRPGLYRPRLPELMGGEHPGLYDAGPMRRTLAELMDLDLLNSGRTRLSVMTVDLLTGQETPFDTAHGRLELDHIMASAALIPDFPAVTIGGRQYVDGGLAANVPVDLVLTPAPTEPLSVFAADPLPSAAPLPRKLGEASERQTDLIFACQTNRTLRAMQQLWALRDMDMPGALYRLSYAYQPGEVALKGFDFSQSSLDRRWAAGEADMRAALRTWRAMPPSGRGLQVHGPVALADAA